jgi:hypothetical protein
MKKLIFFLGLALFLADTSIAQTKLDAWVGVWKGQLQIFSGEGKKQEIPMELHILPLDSGQRYIWKIIYDKSPRDYNLLPKEPLKGIYTLDENNGIQMDMTLLDNSFVSCFEVMDNLLISSYRLEGKQIVSEIFSFSKKNLSKTGNLPDKQIPEVISYPPTVLQKAVLMKSKTKKKKK